MFALDDYLSTLEKVLIKIPMALQVSPLEDERVDAREVLHAGEHNHLKRLCRSQQLVFKCSKESCANLFPTYQS